MLEPGVDRGWKDQIRCTQLLDAAQSLKLRRIDEFDFERSEFDVAVHGVANQFSCHDRKPMAIESFEHTFYDIEIEKAEGPSEAWLVKILSVSAHRFTYLVHGVMDESAVAYIKTLLDAAVFGDMVIEHGSDGWQARESPGRLRKHG